VQRIWILFYFSCTRHFLWEKMIFRDPDFHYFILLLYSKPECKIILINNWVTVFRIYLKRFSPYTMLSSLTRWNIIKYKLCYIISISKCKSRRKLILHCSERRIIMVKYLGHKYYVNNNIVGSNNDIEQVPFWKI